MWQEIASSQEFKQLVRAKFKVVAPATVFFVIYYFALPVLVGYAPSLMERKVIGNVNIAYLFALSQFFVAWGIAAMYLRAAARFDVMAKKIIEQQAEGQAVEHAQRKRDSMDYFVRVIPNSSRCRYHQIAHEIQTNSAPIENNAKPVGLTPVPINSALIAMMPRIAPAKTNATTHPAYHAHSRRCSIP